MIVELRRSMLDPRLSVMGFLNEAVLRYPSAINFGPGRPSERHFRVEDSLQSIERFVAHRAKALGWDHERVFADLGQYGRTQGIIADLVARQLAVDEGMEIDPASIVLTAGCQEAMALVLMGLFEPDRDVLLVSDPTYIGITHLAHILGIAVHPVPTGPNGLEAEKVVEAAEAIRRQGKRPKAVYLIPDFDNPRGSSMPLSARKALLAAARDRELLIIEDNPYGMFAYDGPPEPTLKQLDPNGGVIYLGSFSKTLFPGLRVGYLIADQEVDVGGRRTPLAEELAKIKSLTTVNTSALLQAVVGGVLLDFDASLRPLMKDKLPFYRANRDQMLTSLEAHCARFEGVRWNRPRGGFFLTVELPFEFGTDRLKLCAEEHGVIVCPMSFFSLGPGTDKEIRLSFSSLQREQIETGIARLARFIDATLGAC
jgi:(S)-3,5-dihydroxyphenylglycine transaminase